MPTFIDLFSGGGGASCGAYMAGLAPIAAVEYDEQIAGCYRVNHGDHVTVKRIQDVEWWDIPRSDMAHASPVCKKFSVANANRGEGPEELEQAQAIARMIRAHRPKLFTLENVPAYGKSEAIREVRQALYSEGYRVQESTVNSADYGVPQTRRRLILRAVHRGAVPPLPKPVPWTGWYEAIEDILHTLPESEFAPWQLRRIPEFIGTALFNESSTMEVREAHEPCASQVASARNANQRAFLVDGKPANFAGDLQVVGLERGVPTVTASQEKHPFRAWLSQGRVVSMTSRALARFQSWPDWMELPDSKSLACTIIGNSVPPLMYQRIVETLLRAL